MFPVENRSQHNHLILHIRFSHFFCFPIRLKTKSEHLQWILRIWIRLGRKFHYKQSILNLGTKFAKNRYYQAKAEKRKMTIELYIFQLVLVPSFNLNRQFWFFELNLSKNGISCLKQKKVNSTTRLCIFNLVLVPNFSLKLVSAIF